MNRQRRLLLYLLCLTGRQRNNTGWLHHNCCMTARLKKGGVCCTLLTENISIIFSCNSLESTRIFLSVFITLLVKMLFYLKPLCYFLCILSHLSFTLLIIMSYTCIYCLYWLVIELIKGMHGLIKALIFNYRRKYTLWDDNRCCLN